MFARVSLRRVFLRALFREGSLTSVLRLGVRVRHAAVSRQSTVTKHGARCRVTGRARQVLRFAFLSRMQLRLAAAEGRLPGVKLGRGR